MIGWPKKSIVTLQVIALAIYLSGSTYAQSELPTVFQTLPRVPEGASFEPIATAPTNDIQSALIIPAQRLMDLGVARVPESFGYADEQPGTTPLLLKPWWTDCVSQPKTDSAMMVELDELIWLAISHSPHVQSVLLEPQILDAQARSKLGVFDPNRFVDTIFKDTSDPVGNSLVTGGPPRLNDNLWENRAGVRSKNQYGGQTELFQELNFKNSNSRFFTPDNQSDSKLVLQYTQPLRRGRGSTYNRSSFVIASIAASQSRYQTTQQLQEHAYQITQAYWNLYTAKATQQQVQRGLENLQKLRDRLIGRSEIDSLKSQILRAEAAITRQEANAGTALAQARTSDVTLRALVASPELRESQSELVPISNTLKSAPQLDTTNERLAALDSQPRILEVQEEIKAARTKLQVAQNELQPTLNLVLQGYLRGLKGDYDVGRSVVDELTSTPSYHAGFAYQRPKGNVAAQAIARESRMELRKALLRLDNTLLQVGAQVESAVASVEASFKNLESAIRATLATQAEIEFLEAQWSDAFLTGSAPSSLQIDQLLNAHIQLISAENSWVTAERDYMLALAQLSLANGTLVSTHSFPQSDPN